MPYFFSDFGLAQTVVSVKEPCGVVATSPYQLVGWMANDGGVLIDAKNNGNTTIALIQCQGRNNRSLGLVDVECNNGREIIFRCVMDTESDNLVVSLFFRQEETTFIFELEGIIPISLLF